MRLWRSQQRRKTDEMLMLLMLKRMESKMVVRLNLREMKRIGIEKERMKQRAVWDEKKDGTRVGGAGRKGRETHEYETRE